MLLTPREQEKLLIYVVADLARKRRGRGLKLNVSEATALIAEALLEGARDGRTVAELMELGRHVLGRDDVMDEVPVDAAGGAGRGDLPRWHQADLVPRPDYLN